MDSKKRCHVCGNRVGKYLPLAGGLLNKLSEYTYNLQTNPLETCNVNDYQCPYCGATDRDRLQAIFLDGIVKNNNKFSILEISPSTPISYYIHKHFPAALHLTMDLYRTDVDYQLDITDMYKFRDEQFDLFLCSHVLEHVRDDQKAISELYRILKKRGQGVILVPLLLGVGETDEEPSVSLKERWRRFGQDDHVRQYGKADFVRRLLLGGFTVKEWGLLESSKEIFDQNCIEYQAILYIVTK